MRVRVWPAGAPVPYRRVQPAIASAGFGPGEILLSGFFRTKPGIRQRAAEFEPTKSIAGSRVGGIGAGGQQLGTMLKGQRVAVVDGRV